MISKPGRIGLTNIPGVLGWGIKFAQFCCGDGFNPWEHAFVDLGDGTMIYAEPGGAVIKPLSDYDDQPVYYCDNIYRTIDPVLGKRIAREARSLEGVPYSFADYADLLWHQLGFSDKALKRSIASSGHMICSQLADTAYFRAGVHIFNDGRWPGYVKPGDLYKADQNWKQYDQLLMFDTERRWG